jgi:hypothetical protein
MSYTTEVVRLVRENWPKKPSSKWKYILVACLVTLIILSIFIGLIYLTVKILKSLSSKKSANFYLPRVR